MNTTDSSRDPVEEMADEFIKRRRRGETPALEEYVSKFPELADQIRDLFPALVMMERLATETSNFSESPLDAPAQRPCARLEQLGDYRILREVGRGGMGIVYEAEQVSLGRRVALKVLSGHCRLDRGQLRRFEREARSAARLHHTNIVPVFGVGEQDGLHYYVMQFIQGQGLDEVLRELKRLRAAKTVGATAAITNSVRAAAAGQSDVVAVTQSLLSGQFHLVPQTDVDDGERVMLSHSADLPAEAAPAAERGPGDSSVTLPGQSELSSVVRSEYQYARSVARIGVQVAGALEYADTQGILHRDIKPSNLLLDLKGTVWVTDFGLAKASEVNDLTHTGDIVGTLRYMAPERFRGRCDARADVYSLGLTLYELLALRPAYDEHDRQRLIQLVTQEQPSRLRKLNPAVPRDLATIVHKAIESEPDRRYPTAGALAEDLQRFIDDKPIRARHIRPHERLLRWGRRNKAMMAAVVLVSLSLVLGTAVSAWQAVRATKAKDAEHETAIGLAKANKRLKKEEQATARELPRDTQQAEDKATHELFAALLAQARAGRLTRQPGQRFGSLRAVQEALKLPLPKGRSLSELRTEAIACLCLPDLEVAQEWDGCPTGTGALVIDDAFERYARDDKDGNVSVRRIADDEELFRLPGEGTPLWGYSGLKFSPDGRFLHLLWNCPQGLRGRLWRLDQGAPAIVLAEDHLDLMFRPDSQMFAAAYTDGSIRLFDAQTAREVRRFPNRLLQTDAATLYWNPRLPQLAIRSGATCRMISVDNGEIQAELTVPGFCDWMDWHPDGRLVAMSGHDMKIYLYEVAGRRLVVPPLEGHKSYGIIMRFNHAGDWLASNDWNGMLRLWDTRTGRQMLAQPAHGNCLSFSRDDRLLAADLSLAKVRLFRCRTGPEFRTVVVRAASAAEGYKGHAVRARDDRLVALWAPNGVALVDTLRGEEVATLSLSAADQPLCFEPRDDALWTKGLSGMLRWPLRSDLDGSDPAGGRLHLGPPQTMNASTSTIAGSNPDGRVICLQDVYGGTLLWRRATQAMVPLGPQDDVRFVAVSPDGKWVATGSHGLFASPGAKVWDAATGRHAADLPVGGFCGVRFSPDGRWLVTTGGGPRLWAVGAWQEGPKLAGPRLGADVCFTADSQLLALEGSLSEVCLVRTETGREITRLTAPEQTRLVPQAFTMDGTQLVTFGKETGALHIFDLRAIRAQLCELGLDWDAPPFPSSPATTPEPLDVQVEMGNFQERKRAEELVGWAAQHSTNKEYAKTAEALREAIRVDPTHAGAHNNLAWLLLTGSEEMRDPNAALPLARKAVELASDEATYHNTLGAALYRTGHFADAVGVLETSLRQSNGASDAFDLFFLAMCHHRLGDAAQATNCRDRAALWFSQHRDKLPAVWVEELTEFQAEANSVLAQPPGEPGPMG